MQFYFSQKSSHFFESQFHSCFIQFEIYISTFPLHGLLLNILPLCFHIFIKFIFFIIFIVIFILVEFINIRIVSEKAFVRRLGETLT